MAPTGDTIVRAHVTVTGRVQRVYFRQTTAEQARALGLAGWVRNAGADVEAVFEGPRLEVEQMLVWCNQGPPQAAVERVDVTWEQPESMDGFTIRS